MLVTHIIPAAFNYFDDIKKNAFKIVEELSKYGVNCKVITLQYNQPTKKQQSTISNSTTGVAPSYTFSGNISLQDGLTDLIKSDIIHLHCPFMGGAKDILKFKIDNPQIPMICTYWRPVEKSDIFSLILAIYNSYYLSQIFDQTDIVGIFNQTFKQTKFKKINAEKFIDLNKEDKEEVSLSLPLTNNVDRLKYNNTLSVDFSLSKLLTLYEMLLK